MNPTTLRILPLLAALPLALPAWRTDAPDASSPAASPAQAALTSALYPEPMEPLALRSALLDQPGNYAVFDLRPAEQHREYHVPGARPIELGALEAALRALPATTRVVLVDRDGTQAWAVAGALHVRLGDAAPLLRVLAGGTARYWRDAEVGARAAAAPASNVPSAPPSTTPPAPAKPRSAGC
ncbi:MAG: rhodanese-like domain-containing protein [Planctomycetes bacterium]|nr:rhodanese-like domain-containing protein [Planctomycetota bacterium]